MVQLRGAKSPKSFPIALTSTVAELKGLVAETSGDAVRTFRFKIGDTVVKDSVVLSSFAPAVIFRVQVRSLMAPEARAALHLKNGETRATRLHQEHVKKTLGSIDSTTTQTAADVKDVKRFLLSNSTCVPPETLALSLQAQKEYHDKVRVAAIGNMQSLKERQVAEKQQQKQSNVDAAIKSKLAGKTPEFLQLYTAAIHADGGAARRQIEKDVQVQLRVTAKELAAEEKIKAAAEKKIKPTAKRAAGKRGGSKPPTAAPANKRPRKNAFGQTLPAPIENQGTLSGYIKPSMTPELSSGSGNANKASSSASASESLVIEATNDDAL